jgi:GTP-binding protein HflX
MWTHLSRYEGGIGVRGPGETQLEEDRRLVATRIRDLKERLREVQARKQREVRSRFEEHTVSLVGYTNAGKSTLMNALTGSDVYVEDKLFSTLDTRTRQWHIKDWGRILLSDTVGFIRDLPHHLVASFKATLEETRQARMLLHVVDASSLAAEEHIKAVQSVLKEIECDKKPTLLVLNKVDRITDPSHLHVLMKRHPRAVAVSAHTREGLNDLALAVMEMLSADFADAEIVTHSGNGRVLSYLAAHAEVYRQEYHDNQVTIHCHLPRHLLHHIQGPDVSVRFVGENGRTI